MPLNLWLIDRTGSDLGLNHCRRDRYLTRHAGGHGYGWVLRAQSVPTVTGTLVHNPIAAINKWVQEHDQLPPAEVVRAAIAEALKSYDDIVTTRGLRAVQDEGDLDLRTSEQKLLMEGLVWVWVRVGLPGLLADWKIAHVEEETIALIGCTCELGDDVGTPEDHDQRGCKGIGWMTRGDVILQSRQVESRYAYGEFKTTGDAAMNWEAQWYHRNQLVAGVLGTERKYHIRVDEVYIIALIKGRNQREWNPEEGKASGPKFQASSLVYAGCRPANPPLLPEDWLQKWSGQYYWNEAEGKRRKVSKDYPRTLISKMSPTFWAEHAGSPSEYWTGWLDLGTLSESYKLIGPIYRQSGEGVDRVGQFTRQLLAEEQRWMSALWELYEFQERTGKGWGTAEFDQLLDQLIPMSRGDSCQSFFGNTCDKLALCDKHPGWENPEMLGFIPRRPHHTPELEQAIDRGLLPPEVGADAESGEEQ
jgi:hypothetical protein